MAVVDGIAAKGNGTAVVDGFAPKADGTAVTHDAIGEANGIQVLAIGSFCSTVKSNEIAVVDDTAARANGMAAVDGIAAKGNGTTVGDGFAPKAVGTAVVDDAAEADGAAVVDGAAPEANGAAVVDVAAKASGTAVAHDATALANGIQPRGNLLKSFQVWMLKGLMFLRLSGVTELVNNSNVNIEFYTTTMGIYKFRFRVNAHQTKHIDMRKLSAFPGAHTAEVVILKVGGQYVGPTFVPEHFVIYKKFKFDQNNMGELRCYDLVFRWPSRQDTHPVQL